MVATSLPPSTITLARIAVATGVSCLLATTASAQVEVRNDGFESGAVAGFQAGFVSGEIGASRLIPSGVAPFRVTKVRLLFGGSTATQTITVEIYDDTLGQTNPGAMVFTGDYEVSGNNNVFQEIDLGGDNVMVPGAFRVGIKFQHNGLPSIARDDDGNINAARNFIFAQGLGWVQSNLLGLTGDWIIRADVLDSGAPGTPDAGPGAPDAGPGAPDAGPSAPDAGTGQSCMVHSECPTGQFCGEDMLCTYECRIDTDCGGGMRCTSLGMCEVNETGGCCQGSADPMSWPLTALILLGGLALLGRRRRGPRP